MFWRVLKRFRGLPLLKEVVVNAFEDGWASYTSWTTEYVVEGVRCVRRRLSSEDKDENADEGDEDEDEDRNE